jgi:hypothetical protein
LDAPFVREVCRQATTEVLLATNTPDGCDPTSQELGEGLRGLAFVIAPIPVTKAHIHSPIQGHIGLGVRPNSSHSACNKYNNLIHDFSSILLLKNAKYPPLHFHEMEQFAQQG